MHDASLAHFVQGQLGPARNLAAFPAQRRAVVNPPSAESGRPPLLSEVGKGNVQAFFEQRSKMDIFPEDP